MSAKNPWRYKLRLFELTLIAALVLLIAFSRVVFSANGSSLFAFVAPPTVATTLTSVPPYWDPATITISANAAAPGGSVTKVEFFEGDTFIGQDLLAPFVFTWKDIPVGNYNIRARVTDNLGQTAWSTVSNFSVTARPSVFMISPKQSEGVPTGNPIILTASASDKDGTVIKVDYSDGANPIGTSTDAKSKFALTWTTPPPGAHNLTAIATDDDGNIKLSDVVNIFVGAAPIVSFTLTNPNNPGAAAPFARTDFVTITLALGAAGAGPATPISKITLLEGNESLGDLNVVTPVYKFEPIGYPRALKAKVRDVNGVETIIPIDIPVKPNITSSEKVINGINVGQTKLFDERSLALMLQSMQSHLVNRDFYDQSSVAAAINKLQGARLDSSSLAVNVTGTPIPAVTTVTNSATAGITETITQAATPAGSPTPGPATTLTTTNAPATTQQTTTQAAINPSSPQLPTQNTAFNFQPAVDQAPQTLLAKQMAMNYEIANLRLLLEGAISDRMFRQPINTGYETISTSSTRARAIVGFRISLDSLSIYKKAVAQVEITIRTRCCQANGVGIPPSQQIAPSLISLVPMESNFNVATISKNAKQFGLGLAVQPISFGLASGKSKEQLYLIQDQDVVSFEGRRSQPVEQISDSDAVTFGWQFRPVLGQEVVRAGPRQVYASLALPNTLKNKFVGSVEVHTYWRRYDSKRKTVGEVIPGSDSYESLNDLIVDSTVHGEPLIPQVTGVNYQDFGAGRVMVWIRGENFLPGTQVLVGDERLSGADNGLYIQGEQDLFFVVPATSLALSKQPRIVGQFGPPVPICQALQPDTNQACNASDPFLRAESNFGLKIVKVIVTPIDTQNANLKILVSSKNNAYPRDDLKPVIIIGSNVYGLGGNTIALRQNGTMMEVVVDVPRQVLINTRKIIVKELFAGADYEDQVALTANPLVTMQNDFMATGVVTLRTDDKQVDLAINGNNFSSQVHVIVGDTDVPITAGACSRGADSSLSSPCLHQPNDSLLLLHIPAAKFAGTKQIIVQQGDAPPFILGVTPPAPVIPKPRVASIDSILENDENEVKVMGTDLTSVEKVLFRGLPMFFDPAKNGQSGMLRVIKDLSDSPGSKTIDFVSKDGSKVTSTIRVNPRPK